MYDSLPGIAADRRARRRTIAVSFNPLAMKILEGARKTWLDAAAN